MKKRIIIIISAVIVIFTLACCITKKEIVIEIVPETSISSNLVRTPVNADSIHINGKKSLTNEEEQDINTLCSEEIENAVWDKILEYYPSSSFTIKEKAIVVDDNSNLTVYYFYDFILWDSNIGYYYDSTQDSNNNKRISGPTEVKVTYKRKSIILSAIFGD